MRARAWSLSDQALGHGFRAFYGTRINEHGVHVQRMNDTEVPLVCLGCSLLDSDYSDYEGRAWTYCDKWVYLPVRKGTCRVRERDEARCGNCQHPRYRHDGLNTPCFFWIGGTDCTCQGFVPTAVAA